MNLIMGSKGTRAGGNKKTGQRGAGELGQGEQGNRPWEQMD
jgi:hypothetical protein